MWIVEVSPIKRGLKKETLSYFASEEVSPGSLVSVPVRGKTIDAIAIDCKNVRDEKQSLKSGSFSLRKITKVKSADGIPSYLFETAHICSQYYRRPKGEMLDIITTDLSLYTHEAFRPNTIVPETDDAQPERLIFQAPLDERIAYYRTRTREAFAKGESLMIVVPTIADCVLFQNALAKGIVDFVITLHSDLTKKKFNEEYKKLCTEKHSLVVIATPIFASLIRKYTNTIILERESNQTYVTPTTPSYDMRTVIEVLARTRGITFIASDSLLRVETLGRRERKEFGTVAPITFRALTPIDISVVAHGIPEEVPTRLRNEQIPALADDTIARLEKVLAKKQHVFCFSVRTGLATFTRCRDCGQVLICEHCDSALVLYSGSTRRVFICNKCKRHIPSEQKCGRCGSWNLSAVGTGTAFINDELTRLFPNTPIFRIDRELTPSRKEAQKTISLFFEAPTAILVGTEMALYYMDKEVDESVVVSLDTLFNIPSYRTGERIINLLLSITERTKNKIIIQTKHTDEDIINLIKTNNYNTWYRNELTERKNYHYPPYATIIKITWRGKESEKQAVHDYLEDALKGFSPDIFHGISNQKGKREHTVNAIIRPKVEDWSITSLLDGRGTSDAVRLALSKLPEDCIITINPDNLLA